MKFNIFKRNKTLDKPVLPKPEIKYKTTCKWGDNQTIFPYDNCPVCGEYHDIMLTPDLHRNYNYECPNTGEKVYGVWG